MRNRNITALLSTCVFLVFVACDLHTWCHTKFNASSLLLNCRHFDNCRHSWKWCKENSQNSETRALIKTPVATLLVERYKKRHLAAQVRSANGLRSIFKFSEILGSTTYSSYIQSLSTAWMKLCHFWDFSIYIINIHFQNNMLA